jgi:hypothetical protein
MAAETVIGPCPGYLTQPLFAVEGVKMSVASDDWNKHFRQEFGNQSIHFPEALRSFYDASAVEDKSIHVLLLNDGMLSSSSMSKYGL